MSRCSTSWPASSPPDDPSDFSDRSFSSGAGRSMGQRMADRDPVHAADLDAVRATLRWGVRLTLVVAAACIAYVVFAPSVENSVAITALALIAIPGTLAVSRVDAEIGRAHV